MIEENIVRSTHAALGSGAILSNGSSYSHLDRYAEDNRITGVTIRANEFTIEGPPDANVCDETTLASAIALLGGGESGRGNVIRDVSIDGNLIETAHVGIAVLGGMWPTATDNVVDDVHIGANRITTAAEPVFVSSNCLGASGNLASATVEATTEPSPALTASSQPGAPMTSPSGWAVTVIAVAIVATLTALVLLTVRRRARSR